MVHSYGGRPQDEKGAKNAMRRDKLGLVMAKVPGRHGSGLDLVLGAEA